MCPKVIEQIDQETSASIISIAARYVMYSVLSIAAGAVGIAYSVLAYIVYGYVALAFSIVAGFFLGLALILIGLFMVFWGLYWMQKEGRRLRIKLENAHQGPDSRSEKK